MPGPPSLRLADLDAVLAPLDRARALPACTYLDPDVFALEQDVIFARDWLCAGRADEVAAPGQWVRAPLTDEGIVVVCGPDSACRGFYNVCRHRATPLLEGTGGRLAEIRCPYHGWTYELSGALREAPHTAGLDVAAYGLRPVRVESWNGLLFATQNREAPALSAHLGAAAPRVAGALSHLRLGRRVEYVVRANWKLVVENFQESLHFAQVHPCLEHLTPSARASSELSDGPWLGGIMDIADGTETVSIDGMRHDRPYLAGTSLEDRRRVYDALLFPTLLLSVQPDYYLAYRLAPRSAGETHVTAEIHFHSAAFVEGFDAPDVFTFWDRVNAEDRFICERQQIGIGSRGHVPGPFTTVEDGVHAFNRLVARRYLEALR